MTTKEEIRAAVEAYVATNSMDSLPDFVAETLGEFIERLEARVRELEDREHRRKRALEAKFNGN